MERSRASSHFIASILMWANLCLFIPSIPLVLIGVLVSISPPGLGTPIDPEALALEGRRNAAMIIAVFLGGCLLLWGYRRHARHNIATLGGRLVLWIATVLYNIGWLVWSLPDQPQIQPNVISMLWQIATIVLALVAIVFDLRQHRAAPSRAALIAVC